MSTLPSYITDGLHLIPSHMHGAVERYIMHGIPGGSFLNAVLSNDLQGAFARADLENQHAMHGWAQFIYNYLPASAHGSPEQVAEWIASGGLIGQQETTDEQA